jgi:hypothetical protein
MDRTSAGPDEGFDGNWMNPTARVPRHLMTEDREDQVADGEDCVEVLAVGTLGVAERAPVLVE